ncbi:Tfp pilus assembly protein FimT/FimU [Patescibacteria group bacterium]
MKKKEFSLITSAFSLIEILVVVSILAVLVTVGYGRFRDFSRRQALAAVVRQIEGDIRTTQELAIAGKKPESVACTTLEAYKFEVSSSSAYSIYAVCAPEGDIVYKDNIEVSSNYTLGTAPSSISFLTVGRGNDAGVGYTVTVNQTATGDSNTLTVTRGGDVSISN